MNKETQENIERRLDISMTLLRIMNRRIKDIERRELYIGAFMLLVWINLVITYILI